MLRLDFFDVVDEFIDIFNVNKIVIWLTNVVVML